MRLPTKTTVLLIVATILFWFNSFLVYSCDNSYTTVTSYTNNGDGTYTLELETCLQMNGLEGNPDQFFFEFPAGTIVDSYSPSSVSSSGGDVYNAFLTNGNAKLVYETSAFIVTHTGTSLCANYSITLSGSEPTTFVSSRNSGGAWESDASCTETIAIPISSDPCGDCSNPACQDDLTVDPSSPTFNNCDNWPGDNTNSTIISYHTITSSPDGTLGLIQQLEPINCHLGDPDVQHALSNRTATLYAVGDCNGTPVPVVTTNAGNSLTFNPEWQGLSPNTDYIVVIEVEVLSCDINQTCVDYYYPPSTICSADAGTISVDVQGNNQTGTDIQVPYGETANFTSTGYNLPNDGPFGTAGMALVAFSCPPTTALSSPFDPQSDPCYLGILYGDNVSTTNDGTGTSSLGEIYVVYMTFDDASATGGPDMNGDDCVAVSDIFTVTYLPETCGDCSVPNCPVNEVATFDDKDYSTGCNTLSSDITNTTYVTYHTVTTDASGSVGLVQLTVIDPPGCISRSAVLRPIVNTCSESDIIPDEENANTVSSGFNPEWYGLSPNTQYVAIVTTDIGSGCLYEEGCLNAYGIPNPPLCSDDVGVQAPSINGNGTEDLSNNEFVLCHNSEFNLSTTGASPSVDYAIYTCEPTSNDPLTDACYTGYFYLNLNSMIETNDGDNSPVLDFLTSEGISFTDNTIWWVPITTDTEGQFDPICFDMDYQNKSYQVTYLNELTAADFVDCSNGLVTVTIEGGSPEYISSATYTIVNNAAGNLSASTLTSSGGSIDITGLNDGDFYDLTITDGNGCSVDLTGTFVCSCAPPTLVISDPSSVCDPITVDLTDPAVTAGSDAGVLTYWTDAIASTPIPDPTVISTSGTYYIQLDDGTCSSIQPVQVTVNTALTPNFSTFGPYCENTLIPSLPSTSLNGITGTWSPAIDNTTTTSYTFTPTAGTCATSTTTSITVHPLPVVDAGNDLTVCLNTPVTLTGTGAVSYIWDNGVTNGVPFSAINTTTYTVTGTDINNCQNTDQVTVTVNPLPTLNVTGDLSICEGETAQLQVSGAQDYSWLPANAFSTPNASSVELAPLNTTSYTVEGVDANGCQNSETFTLIVNPLPVVDAGDDLLVCAGDEVTLIAETMNASSVQWDNQIVNGQPFVPVQTTVFQATATSLEGCSASDQVTVTVDDIQINDILISVSEGCSPVATELSVLTSNPLSNVNWFIDDVFNSNLSNPQLSLLQPGCYEVRADVTSLNGCFTSFTSTDEICVFPNPVADFSLDKSELTEIDNTISINNSSSDDVISNFWDFGDGSTSTQINPYHTYNLNGGEPSFTISLFVENEYNCVDEISQIIRIKESVIYYVPNAFTPDGDNYNNTFKPVITSGINPYSYKLLIFNRWGETLFESNDLTVGWDGTYNNAVVKEGTYIWTIEMTENSTDKVYNLSGHVTLLR